MPRRRSNDTPKSESGNSSSVDEGFTKSVNDDHLQDSQSRINTMPVNKPFCRLDYAKPRSMIVPSFQAAYIQVRKRRRAGHPGGLEGQ